jgi:hypothetical protein
MNLFPVFRGRMVEIGPETHGLLKERFPELDLQSEYRALDMWLIANPRKLPTLRRIVNWMLKARRLEAKAEYVMSDGVRCRVTAADCRRGRA